MADDGGGYDDEDDDDDDGDAMMKTMMIMMMKAICSFLAFYDSQQPCNNYPSILHTHSFLIDTWTSSPQFSNGQMD